MDSRHVNLGIFVISQFKWFPIQHVTFAFSQYQCHPKSQCGNLSVSFQKFNARVIHWTVWRMIFQKSAILKESIKILKISTNGCTESRTEQRQSTIFVRTSVSELSLIAVQDITFKSCRYKNKIFWFGKKFTSLLI